MHLKTRIYFFLATVALLACAGVLEISVDTPASAASVEAKHALLTAPARAADEQLPKPLLIENQNELLIPATQLWLI